MLLFNKNPDQKVTIDQSSDPLCAYNDTSDPDTMYRNESKYANGSIATILPVIRLTNKCNATQIHTYKCNNTTL